MMRSIELSSGFFFKDFRIVKSTYSMHAFVTDVASNNAAMPLPLRKLKWKFCHAICTSLYACSSFTSNVFAHSLRSSNAFIRAR